MRKKICHWEEKVIGCLKEEKLSPDIKKHVSECLSCQEAVSIYRWMNEFKSKSWDAVMQEKTLPEAEAIWNRAYVKQRPDRRLVKKALRPLIFPRVFSYGVFSVGFIFLFLSKGKEIGNFMYSRLGTGSMLDSISKTAPQIMPIILIPGFIIFISMLFCALVVAFERHKPSIKMPN